MICDVNIHLAVVLLIYNLHNESLFGKLLTIVIKEKTNRFGVESDITEDLKTVKYFQGLASTECIFPYIRSSRKYIQ